MTAVLTVLGLTAIVVGILNTTCPILSRLDLMSGGIQLLGCAGDYQVLGSGILTFSAIAVVFDIAMDYVAKVLGARCTDTGKTAVWGVFIGGIVGASSFIPGLLFGPLAGATIDEFVARKDIWQAGEIGTSTFIDFITDTAARIGCVLITTPTTLFVRLVSLS